MEKTLDLELSRRQLLKTTAIAAGGLVLAYYVPFGMQRAFAQGGAAPQSYPPNAFVRIAPDDSITIVINKLEMGQGVNTSMAQLIADELECDWTKISSVSAEVNPVYNHPFMGIQMTGGSTALASSWEQHRRIGATMREMLKSAAAARWGVKPESCKAEKGAIVHKTKGKLRYGELVDEANQLPVPTDVKLKAPKDYKFIGKSMPRVDAPAKSNGTAQFAMDVRLPGMMYAMVAHPPVAGAKATAVDDKAARAVPGVLDVVKFADRVAVLGKNTHAARKGRDALVVTWDVAESAVSTASIEADFKKHAEATDAPLAEERGKVDESMAKATDKRSMDYLLPFLAHASMEPLNVTINFDGTTCELWSGHQMPGVDQGAAAQVLGIPPASVKVNTTYAGGSFGRRASKTCDYVVIAAQLAKEVKKPLKVVWSREDDMRGGYYRPMAFHRVTLGFDKKKLVAWDHHVVCQGIMKGTPFEAMMVKNGIEGTAVEGIAGTHYDVGPFRCRQTLADSPMTTLWWRSVGHTHTAFVMETMMDELAEATGKDPLTMRRELAKKSPRHVAVLDLLAKISGWPKKKPEKGRAFGLAVHESFNTVVGQVVEVSLDGKTPRVHRVWAAAHCGQVVNPEVAKSQVESAIVFGLSAALYQEIKIEKGAVVTGNFDDFPVLRMSEMPVVEIAFVPSTDAPTGLGEPGVPPIAPAVANAVYKLTKTRVRTLPFARSMA